MRPAGVALFFIEMKLLNLNLCASILKLFSDLVSILLHNLCGATGSFLMIAMAAIPENLHLKNASKNISKIRFETEIYSLFAIFFLRKEATRRRIVIMSSSSNPVRSTVSQRSRPSR